MDRSMSGGDAPQSTMEARVVALAKQLMVGHTHNSTSCMIESVVGQHDARPLDSRGAGRWPRAPRE
jgi:hypothetical protein